MNKIHPLFFEVLARFDECTNPSQFDGPYKTWKEAGKPVVEEHREQMYARCGHAVGVKPRERCLVESCWNHGSFAEEGPPTPEFWKRHMKEVREILEPPAIEGMKQTINKLEGELHGAKEKIKELEKQVWERTEEIKVASVTLENLRTIRKELEAKLSAHGLLKWHIEEMNEQIEIARNAALEEAAKELDGWNGWKDYTGGHWRKAIAARIRGLKKP